MEWWREDASARRTSAERDATNASLDSGIWILQTPTDASLANATLSAPWATWAASRQRVCASAKRTSSAGNAIGAIQAISVCLIGKKDVSLATATRVRPSTTTATRPSANVAADRIWTDANATNPRRDIIA